MPNEKSPSLELNLPAHPDDDEGPEYWQSHLDSWVQSGLSQASYCRRHDLDYGRFRKWKERLSTYPKHSSIKLVEVKRDFAFNGGPHFQTPFFGSWGSWCSGANSPSAKIPPEINRVGGHRFFSGIRFWYGPFCIEIEKEFSSESLCQLIGSLQSLEGTSSYSATGTGGTGCNKRNSVDADCSECAEDE